MPLAATPMGRMDIIVRQEEPFTLSIKAHNVNDAEYNFSGCTALFSIYLDRRSSLPLFSVVPVISSGKIEIPISAEQLRIAQRIYSYQLTVTYSDSSDHCWLQGSFSVGDFESRRSSSDVFIKINDELQTVIRLQGFQAPQPKVYKAILNQSGSSAPAVIILENTLGTLQWTRGGAGFYICSFSEGFPVDKTVIMVGDVGPGQGFMGLRSYSIDSPTTFILATLSMHEDTGISFQMEDSQLLNTAVEVYVYP